MSDKYSFIANINRRYVAAFLLIIVALSFAPLLTGNFLWDDRIFREKQLIHYQTLKEVFVPDTGMQHRADNYYRPIVILSHFLNIKIESIATGVDIFNSQAKEWDSLTGKILEHSFNISIHLYSTALVWWILWQIMEGRRRRYWAAFAGALVFGLHPIHAESVCFVAGRSDVLGSLFTLGGLALVLYWRKQQKLWILAASIALYFLGLLSKENAIMLLPTAIAVLYFFPLPQEPVKKNQKPENAIDWAQLGYYVAGIVVTTFLYFWIRKAVNITMSQVASTPEMAKPILLAIAYYYSKLFIPWPQLHYVSGNPYGWIVVVGALIFLGWTALSVMACKKGEKGIMGANLIFLITIAPYLAVAISTMAESPVAERYLYLPSMAMSILVAIAISSINTEKMLKYAWYGLAALSVIYSASLLERSYVWREEVRFWRDEIKSDWAGKFGLPWANLGVALQTSGQFEEAKKAYEYAISSNIEYDDEGRSIVLNNLATMDLGDAKRYYLMGNNKDAIPHADAAIRFLTKAIEIRPNYVLAMGNLGSAIILREDASRRLTGQVNQANLQLAERYFRTALSIDPRLKSAQRGLEDLRNVFGQ